MSWGKDQTLPGGASAVPRSAMLSDVAWEAIAGELSLSPRQVEIVRGVFDDEIEAAIASRLGISSHTVHTHIERIHQKLNVRDRVELVLRVIGEFLRLTARPGSLLAPICGRQSAGACPWQNEAPESVPRQGPPSG